jgi:hypothetical protein
MRSYLCFIVLAACSPVVVHLADSSIDSSPDAPTHGMVSVKVLNQNGNGMVVVGAPVVFVGSDGTTEIGQSATGSDGIASADVPTGASATVVLTTAGSAKMQTVLGLQPGDNITVGQVTPSSTTLGTFSVSFPTYSGASTYQVYGPCGNVGGTTSPVTLSIISSCKRDQADITVVAFDALSNPLAAVTAPNVAFVPFGTASVTGSYTGLTPFAASYTDVDAVITSIALSHEIPDNLGFTRSVSGTPANNMLTLQAPAPVATTVIASSRFINGQVAQMYQQSIAGNLQSYQLDVGTSLLPWITMASLDPANHKIAMTIDTTGTSMDTPDVVFAQALYTRTINTTTTNFTWLIIGPTPGDIVLPMIPISVGDVMPQSTDTSPSAQGVMIETDLFNGYNDVRPDLYKAITGVTSAPHPTAMRIRESMSFNH